MEGPNRTLCTSTQDKGALTLQEIDPDLSVSVQESPAEAWFSGGLLQGVGALSVAVHAWDLLKEVTIIFPGGSDGKVSAYNAGDPGSIPRSGRSPAEGNGNPLQYSCLESPVDKRTLWVTVHGVANSRTRCSYFRALERSRN